MARHAETVGAAPRIEPLDESEMPEEGRELVRRIRASAGASDIDTVPEYMRTMLRHPEIFRCQMAMGTALFNGRIPALERELAILRIGWLCQAPYEYGQHVIIARRLGMSAQDIERARNGSAAPGHTRHEAAILRGVEELLENKVISEETWTVLAESWDEAQLIEFPVMVGQYVAPAYTQNSIRFRLEPENDGLASV